MASRLSENRVGRDCTGTISSNNIDFTHCSLVAVAAIAHYLASVEEQATMRYFVELQDIGLTPRNIRKAHVEVRSLGLPAQSALEKPCNV